MFDKIKRRRNLKCHFGKDDILIEEYRLNAVHYIPAKIEKGLELDFYMDTGDDIYLLRLQNKPDNDIIFVNRESIATKVVPVTYIIARKSLSSDINFELSLVIRQLKQHDFPKNKGELTYEVSDWT